MLHSEKVSVTDNAATYHDNITCNYNDREFVEINWLLGNIKA